MARYKRKNKPQQNDSAKKAEEIKEEIESVESEELEAEEAEEAEASEDVDLEEIESEDIEEIEEDDSEDEEEEAEEEEKPKAKSSGKAASDSSREEFLKLSFVERCKKDPVIPVMILLAFVMIIVAAIYFIVPGSKVKSLGITLEEFKTRYNSADVALEMYNNGQSININYTDYYDATATSSILGDKETFTVDSNYVDYFYGDVSLLYTIGMEGATRKSDEEIAVLRIFVEFDPDDTNDIFLLAFVYANTLQALYPDLGPQDAKNLAMDEMSAHTDGVYTCRGDYAFRLIPFRSNDAYQTTYVAIEVVPKSALDSSQQIKVLEMPETTSAATEATVAETAAAST